MKKYRAIAYEVQNKVRNADYSDVNEYSDEQVKQAIVHSREDIVLLVSYLASLNDEMRFHRWLSIGSVILLVLIFAYLMGFDFWGLQAT